MTIIQTKRTGQTVPSAPFLIVGVASPRATVAIPSKRWSSMAMALMLALGFGMVAGCDNSDKKGESQQANPSAAVTQAQTTGGVAAEGDNTATTKAANDSDSSHVDNSLNNTNNADTAATATAIETVAPSASQTSQISQAAPPDALSATAGKDLYEQQCHMCHDAGLLEAPKIGDKEAWAPRIAKGIDVLHQHSAQGYEKMPAQATGEVTAAQVYAAVDYLVAQSR